MFNLYMERVLTRSGYFLNHLDINVGGLDFENCEKEH